MDFVANMLTKWKLENFTERFSRAGIDEEMFKNLLDDQLIDELFDKSECGFKKKFKTKFTEWKSKIEIDIEETNKLSNSDSISSIDSQQTEFKSTMEVVVKETNQLSNSDSISSINSRQAENNILLPNPFSGLSIEQPPQFESGEICYIPTIKKTVSELLTSTTQGKLILRIFKKDEHIQTSLITSLIINYEFDASESYRISKERFTQLAEELGVIFASSSKSASKIATTFYYPYTKATKTHKAVNSGGALYDKYLNFRRKLIAYDIINEDSCIEEDTPLSVHEETINWLQENDSPEKDVINKWTSTFNFRDRCKNALNYLASFKCLCSSFGHILLAHDFDLTYPELKDSLIDKWAAIASLIILIGTVKRKLNDDIQLIATKNKEFAAFLLLPRLLGILIRKRKNSEPVFGSTINDVTDSFIHIVKSEEELVAFKNTRKVSNSKTGKKIMPYIAFVGNFEKEGDENEIEVQTYVIINDFNFKVNSNKIVEAVSYCFKCIVSLNLDFPNECKHVWTFLQQYVFEIELDTFKPYAVVNKLIEELKALELKNNTKQPADPVNLIEK